MIASRDVGFLIGADIPLSSGFPAGPKDIELAARSAEGSLQYGVRAKMGQGGFTMQPKLEAVYAVNSKVRTGVHFQLPEKGQAAKVQARLHWKQCGASGALWYEHNKQHLCKTVMFPKQTLGGYGVTLTAQLKYFLNGDAPQPKVVADVEVSDAVALKLKGDISKSAFTVSTILKNLAGGMDLTVGVTSEAGKLRYGMSLAHGYYSFMGW